MTMADNIAEIVRYWDKTAECEEKKRNGQWVAKAYKIDEELIRCFYAGEVRNIRPILRPLSSVTSEDVNRLIMISFGWDVQPKSLTYHFRDNSLFAKVQSALSPCWFEFELADNGCIEVRLLSTDNAGEACDLAHYTNATAVIDYLDSLSIDIRGMLQKGLAVEETV